MSDGKNYWIKRDSMFPSLLLFTLFSPINCEPLKDEPIKYESSHYEKVAQKIWQNECGAKELALTSWNQGEEFASLGIGHFIWYPEGKIGPFQEQFPAFLAFATKKGASLPSWLSEAHFCPWKTREDFLKELESEQMIHLRKFLLSTFPLQAEFMGARLESCLPHLTSSLTPEEKEHVDQMFYAVLSSPQGLYALTDYLNFKGEGTSFLERYQGEGWGLLQVLQGMQNFNSPIQEFVKTAKSLLEKRVKNAPVERNESKWLQGWCNRLDTYLE